MPPTNRLAFDRCNIHDISTAKTVAHGGVGEIAFARLLDIDSCDGALNFVDIAVLAPGVSIGRHGHRPDEEEYYLILEGEGEMWRDGSTFPVKSGDFIRNKPGGEHSLMCTGNRPLRIFVFEVKTR